MSKVGATKLGRMFAGEQVKTKYTDPKTGKEDEYMRVVITRKPTIDPATLPVPMTIRYKGYEMIEMMTPGQIINPKKAFKRMLKRNQK